VLLAGVIGIGDSASQFCCIRHSRSRLHVKMADGQRRTSRVWVSGTSNLSRRLVGRNIREIYVAICAGAEMGLGAIP
jgi:hypothetical protein